jgi:hypothetical protein
VRPFSSGLTGRENCWPNKCTAPPRYGMRWAHTQQPSQDSSSPWRCNLDTVFHACFDNLPEIDGVITLTEHTRCARTVVFIVRKMEELKIPYAIARNYEAFPDFTHDVDLFAGPDHSEQFRGLIRAAVAEFSWDIATECKHWSRSPVDAHHVECFHLYKIETLEHLRFDLFHAFLAWGLPFMLAKDLISSRVRHASNQFYHVDPARLAVVTMLQINRLLSTGAPHAKILRYRDRVLKNAELDCEAFYAVAAKVHFLNAPAALDAIRAFEWPRFRILMNRSKIAFLWHGLGNPVGAVLSLTARVRDYCRFYHSAPCGFPVQCPPDFDLVRSAVIDGLELLVRSNCLSGWSRSPRWSWTARRTMERGGVVVARGRKMGAASIHLSHPKEVHGVATQLLRMIIERHETLAIRAPEAE